MDLICLACGAEGLHACTGRPISPPTSEEEAKLLKAIEGALVTKWSDTGMQYVSTKIVTAWPELKDGQDGYGVRYVDGYVSWSPKQAFEEGNVLVGVIEHHEPHVQRMYAEEARLASDIRKLKEFLTKVDTGLVKIPDDQKQLMVMQYDAMSLYKSILKERIVLSLKKA